MYPPLSTATWIANSSMVIPGSSGLTLMPDQVKEGALVFLVPDVSMEQVSLHYYDTNYGHMDIPIVGGEMETTQADIEMLPLNVETQLSDGFAITITGSQERNNIANMIEASEANQFTVFDARFTSKVQANLSIDPSKRLSLEYPTDNGSFLIPLDDVTELVPMGMLGDMIVSPGANNQVRYAFHTPPLALANNKANLFVDLGDEDAIIEARDGLVYGDGSKLGSGNHDYASIDVNHLFASTDTVAGHNRHYVIADITIHDVKDGYASRGLIDSLKLVEEGYDNNSLEDEDKFEAFDRKLEMAVNSSGLTSFASSADFDDPHILDYSDKTDEVILGFDNDTIVYDGTSRRGFVLFASDSDTSYNLESQFFEGLEVPVTKSDFDYGLLTEILEYDYNDGFQEELEMAINNAIDAYLLKNSANVSSGITSTDLDDATPDKNNIPVPMSAIYGSQIYEAIDSLESLENLIRALDVKHSAESENRYPYKYAHSPEAVISQGGWGGTIADINNLAIHSLIKLGYNPPKYRMVELTEIGSEKILRIIGAKESNINVLPALVFEKDKTEITWVIPFMESVSDLQNSCYYVFDQDIEHESYEGYLSIDYLIEPNESNVNTN